jgi:hypothetical protein
MAQPLSLMEFLEALLADAELRGDFGDDPQGTLAAHGLADLTPADVHDALVLVQDNQTVDYSLDAAAAALPPPPPVGDDHGAAVEYLAGYLAGPRQTGLDEQWSDPDADAAPTPAAVADEAPFAAFGGGDDAGYGSGSVPPADDGTWALDPEDLGTDTGPGTGAPGDDYEDIGGYDLLDGVPGEELAGDDPDGPGGPDDGTALPEGA